MVVSGPFQSLAQPQTNLTLSPQTLQMKVGEEATVALSIQGASTLYGIEVHLRFDPSALEVVDADPDREGIQIEPGTLPIPDFVVQNVADNQAGTIDYASTQLPPNNPSQGDGVVAKVTFRAKRAASSAISFERYLLADTQGSSLEATSLPGQVQIRGGTPWLYIVGPLLIVLLAGGAAAVAWGKRK